MQNVVKSILFLLPIAFALPAIAQDQLPEGAIQAGSLANQTLVQDTLIGVAAKTATLGCDSPEQVSPYITQNPSGEVGSRVWEELWIVEGCDQEFPLSIRFNEDGSNAANWTILD